MKFKKPRGVLLGIGIGSFVLAAVLFFLIPVICGDKFQYNGLDAFVKGVTALVSFNFVDPLYTALVILFAIALAGLVMYLIVSIQKKHYIHVLIFFITLIFVFGSYVLVSIYFLSSDIALISGDKTLTGKLLFNMMTIDGEVLGKILSSLALAFGVLSNVTLLIHMFVAMVSMFVTEEVDHFEEKVVAQKEQEYNQKIAEAEAKIASNPIIIEKEVVKEAVAVEEAVTAEKLIEEATFEERKAKEEKLFKECVESGYFAEYEEIEMAEPLEGFDEEPVCEISVVEEKTSFITKSSVHVGFSHE